MTNDITFYSENFDLCLAALRQAQREHLKASAPDYPQEALRTGALKRRSEITGRLGLYAGLECIEDSASKFDLAGAARALAEAGPKRVAELLDLMRERGANDQLFERIGVKDSDWGFIKEVVAGVDCTMRHEGDQVALDFKGFGQFDGTYLLVDHGATVASAAAYAVFGRQSTSDLVASIWRSPEISAREINVQDYLGTAARLLTRQLYGERREQEEVADAQFRGAEPISGLIFAFVALAVLFGIISLGIGSASPAPGSPAFWVSVVAGALAAIFAVLACATAGPPTCFFLVAVPASKCGSICN